LRPQRRRPEGISVIHARFSLTISIAAAAITASLFWLYSLPFRQRNTQALSPSCLSFNAVIRFWPGAQALLKGVAAPCSFSYSLGHRRFAALTSENVSRSIAEAC